MSAQTDEYAKRSVAAKRAIRRAMLKYPPAEFSHLDPHSRDCTLILPLWQMEGLAQILKEIS